MGFRKCNKKFNDGECSKAMQTIPIWICDYFWSFKGVIFFSMFVVF